MTRRPFAELDLAPLAHLPPEAKSEAVYRAEGFVADLVDHHAARILERFPDPDSVRPDRLSALEWMAARNPVARFDLAARRGEFERVLAGTILLVERAAEGYPAYLRGEIEGNRILLGPGAAGLWEAYFSNENLSYAAVNRLAAFAADRATSGRILRVLEVGGGCGSGAEALLERLAGRVVEYRFTEVQPHFLRRGEALLRARFPGLPLRAARLDLERPLEPQGIEPGSFDLAYAVNTLHAVRDVGASLSELARALVPGGVLVLGEGVRPRPEESVAIEFVFQLSPRFGRFLWWRDWERLLGGAGFRSVRFEPDLERVLRGSPGYSMAAVAGEA